MKKPTPKNTLCLWYDCDALKAARFYAKTFPNSQVTAVHKAPTDFPSGKKGQVLTVEFTVLGLPCIGLNGGPAFKPTEAFSFQIATDTQEETDRYWNALVKNGGQKSYCGWCKDRWGISWQITPRVLTQAIAAGGETARRAFTAMMEMDKIDIAKIEAACGGAGRRGRRETGEGRREKGERTRMKPEARRRRVGSSPSTSNVRPSTPRAARAPS